jgi:hypothetical protein
VREEDKKYCFDGEFDVLQISPDACEDDIRDMIGQRLLQLLAMLSVQGGYCGPDNSKTRNHRSNHLWLFYRTVNELQSLSSELWDRHS